MRGRSSRKLTQGGDVDTCLGQRSRSPASMSASDAVAVDGPHGVDGETESSTVRTLKTSPL
jgi:hypothetical protein